MQRKRTATATVLPRRSVWSIALLLALAGMVLFVKPALAGTSTNPNACWVDGYGGYFFASSITASGDGALCGNQVFLSSTTVGAEFSGLPGRDAYNLGFLSVGDNDVDIDVVSTIKATNTLDEEMVQSDSDTVLITVTDPDGIRGTGDETATGFTATVNWSPTTWTPTGNGNVEFTQGKFTVTLHYPGLGGIDVDVGPCEPGTLTPPDFNPIPPTPFEVVEVVAGTSTNPNACWVDGYGGYFFASSITASGDGALSGNQVFLSGTTVEAEFSDAPSLDAYTLGFLSVGDNDVDIDVVSTIKATNTLDEEMVQSDSDTVLITITDPDGSPGTGDETATGFTATVNWSPTTWTPTGNGNVEFTQGKFTVTLHYPGLGGIDVDIGPCEPGTLNPPDFNPIPPTPFEVVEVSGPGNIVATGDLAASAVDGDLLGTNITWDNLDYRPQFFPCSVNLGATSGINVMQVPPGNSAAGAPSGTPPSGNFFTQFFSDQGDLELPIGWNSVLGFFNYFEKGEYVCTNPPYIEGTSCSKGSPLIPIEITFVASELNLFGTFVDEGPGTLPTQLGGVPIIYSLDGAQTCFETATATIECSGRVNLSAFRGFGTPTAGVPNDPNNSVPVDVNASFIPPGGGMEVPVVGTVTYDQVLDTGFTTMVTSSQAGGSIPPNFAVDVPGWVQIFLDISTTATLPEPTTITVCGDYLDEDPPDGIVDGTPARECDLRFLHNEGEPPGVFVDRTMAADDVFCPFDQQDTTCPDPETPEEDFLCINTVANQICAGVTSLFSGVVLPRNNPPAIQTLDVTPAPAALGEPVTATANFCDSDLWQTHTVTIDWGDGTSATIELPAGSGPEDECQDVSETREVYAPGVHTVTVTVEDEAASDSAADFAVIYDPDGGFVTGGGWIDSPEGAYAFQPDLTGKANFGFVSKYKKGAAIPSGNTNFQFKAADLHFKSTSYQWLVIAGARAKFKGYGTINGAGDYGFMLTGIDGDLKDGGGVDKFRIKIWDSGDNIVYDNKIGEDEDAEPTALGGGSIVIHTEKK